MDDFTYVALLKACVKKKDLYNGSKLHADILRKGSLGNNPYLASSIINMYAKCGAIAKAQQVFEELSVKDVVSWSALISGFAQCGKGRQALICFDKMQREGFSPDVVTLISVIGACSNIRALDKGREIHKMIVNQGLLGKHIVLATALVNMYIKCSFISLAEEILQELSVRDVVFWNALITGYLQQGQAHKILTCYDQMRSEGLYPDAVTFICMLKFCSNVNDVNKGRQFHNEILNRRMTENVVIGNVLVDMYAKCGFFVEACQVLEQLLVRDVVSWNALIAGYAQQGLSRDALICFEQMQSEGLHPNIVTFICVLKACANLSAIEKGKEIHDRIKSMDLLQRDILLGTALVDMYSKCSMVETAHELLSQLPHRDVIAWNTIIAAYAQQGQVTEALNCFEQMISEGFFPDNVTYLSILQCCEGTTVKGKQIHNELLCRGSLNKDIVLGNALVNMYAKCGSLEIAQEVFDGLPVRDIVSWNALIAGYVQQGQFHEALNCYENMLSEGLCSDSITFICLLKACGNIGAIDKGSRIHDEINNMGLLQKDIVLGNALIDMYAKCGVLARARQVVEDLYVRDIVSWNALIAGYTGQGQLYEALDSFRWMKSDGISPDDVTFLCVLTACSHSGLLYEAQQLFSSMTREYGITPNIGHHTCMVVAYGYAGDFIKAMSVIQVMPFVSYPAVWLAFLGACRKWENVNLGRLAFDQIVQLDSGCAAAYVVMANIFTAAGMLEDAKNIDIMRIKYATSNKSGTTVSLDPSGNGDLWDAGRCPESNILTEISHGILEENCSLYAF